jgi:hypothetical protein
MEPIFDRTLSESCHAIAIKKWRRKLQKPIDIGTCLDYNLPLI